MMTLRELLRITDDPEKLMQFLCDRGVFKREVKCNTCDSVVPMKVPEYTFRCRAYNTVKKPKKKAVKVRCDFSLSARVGTLFENSNIPVSDWCAGIGFFLIVPNPRQDVLAAELKLQSEAIVRLQFCCREVSL